jgi:WD40 repeat protein
MIRFPGRWLLLLLLPGIVACSPRGEEIERWLHEDTGEYSAAFSDDGKLLLTGSIGGYGRVWELENNRVRYSVQHEDSSEGGIIGADFSADGRILVVIEPGYVSRWRVSDGKLLGFWEWPDLRAVAVSANGRYALLGMKRNQSIYFDMQAGKMVYVFPHREQVNSVALSRDGRFALTGSDDWHVSLWNLSTGEHVWSKNMKYKVALVAISDDGAHAMANAYIGPARIFATDEAGSLVSELDVPVRGVTFTSADFSDDGRLLATGRASKGIDIWDVQSGRSRDFWVPPAKHFFQPDAATIIAININPDNKTLLTESSTGIGQLWALK